MPDDMQPPRPTVRPFVVLGTVGAVVLAFLVFFLLAIRSWGIYTLVVRNQEAWLYNSRDDVVVGPITELELPDGDYVLTGNKKHTAIKVTFRDETRRPGRITFEVAGKQFDVMERGVYIDGEYTDWQVEMPTMPQWRGQTDPD